MAQQDGDSKVSESDSPKEDENMIQIASPRSGGSRVRTFSGVSFDIAAGELRLGSRRRRLTPKDAQLLEYLTRVPRVVVSRRQLREELWPGAIIEFDSALNSAIKRLRRALEDSARDPRFIETLPGRGYRFMLPVEASGEDAPPEVVSLVVTPVLSLGDSDEGHSLAEALTEELLAVLFAARVGGPALRVSIGGSAETNGTGEATDLYLRGALMVEESSGRLTLRIDSGASGSVVWAHTVTADAGSRLGLVDELAGRAAEGIKTAVRTLDCA